jgi:GNAT superfamily N-acetyltransferase
LALRLRAFGAALRLTILGNDRYIVRPTISQDRDAWLEMWRGYCDFYEARVSDAVTDATWRRILAADSSIFGLVATSGSTGEAAGFANYIAHPYTWSELPACYLEDLFVRPEARGTGAGRAILEHLVGLGRAQHWGRLYWMTRESNDRARRVYDHFCAHDDFIRYVLTFEAAPTA